MPQIKILIFCLAYIMWMSLHAQNTATLKSDDQYPTLEDAFSTVTLDKPKTTPAPKLDGQRFPVLETHINNKQFKQAYQRALELRDNNEGTPRFDYLMGVSALQLGYYSDAIFTLERVTTHYPAVIRPHLELATAYYRSNNKESALQALNTALTLDPPASVRKKINDHIVAIETNEKGTSNAHITFSLGYDDNINLGFADENISLPIFGNVALSPNSVQQGSAFSETALQFDYQTAPSNRRQFLTSAGLTSRVNFANSDFNTHSLNLSAGSLINRGKNHYQFAIRNQPVFLDDDFYSNTIGVGSSVLHKRTANSDIITGLSFEHYDNKRDDNYDRKRAIVSAKANKKSGKAQHEVGAYLAKELPNTDAGKAFSRDMVGVGYQFVRQWAKKHRSSFKVNYQYNKHQAPQALYQTAREDDQLSLELANQTRINELWKINTSLRHQNTQSNLQLFDSSRNEIQVGIQYDWH